MSNLLDEARTLLFTSVGNEALHGFVEDLRDRAPQWQLLGIDVREDAAGRFLCDKHWTCPRRDAPNFQSWLQELVRDEHVDLVVPLSTEDQDWFAAPAVHQALAPATVLSSTPQALARSNRKIGLFEALAEFPELLPPHANARNVDHLMELVREFTSNYGALLVKSDAGTGGRGMVCIGEPTGDAAPAAGRSFLSTEVWRQLCHAPRALQAYMAPSIWGPAARWPQQVVAWLPGAEYSVDVLADEGVTLRSVIRLRTAATGGLALTAQVVYEPAVAEAARQVVRATGVSHVVNVQFRRDAQGVPRLLEVNPRIPGTIGLTVAAGLNLPLAAFVRALGGELSLPERPIYELSAYRFQGMVVD